MSFLSCEEMLAAARSQNISLSEAILRSDLAESRLTEAHSREMMHHLWQVMQATSRDYDPAQRSRSGLSGGDAAKVEQAHQGGQKLGGDYLAAVTAEALKTAECNACMKRIVAAPTAGSCGVLPAVLLPLARSGEANEEAICDALYVAAGFGQVIAPAPLAGARLSGRGGRRQRDGRRRPLPPQGRRAGAVRRRCRNGTGQPAGPRLRPCGRRGGSLHQAQRRRRRKRRCANMALAGVEYAIPCDEVIDAMGRVGAALPDLRETGQGGLAATPTGVRIAQALAEQG